MSPARTPLLAGLSLLAAGWLFGGQRPSPAQLLPPVLQEPQQQAVAAPAFAVHRGGIAYRIAPVADYEIAGLVVSRHDTRTWWDMRHWVANDYLNVVDLCVVWGANAAEGAYEHMSFFSGQWTCYFRYADSSRVKAAHLRALSNNHLLTDRNDIARQLLGVRVGDQVRLRGQLVSYSHDEGFHFQRGTSVSRDDEGDGACETVFVQQVEILRRGAAWPQLLRWLGWALLLLGGVIWWRTPFGARAW